MTAAWGRSWTGYAVAAGDRIVEEGHSTRESAELAAAAYTQGQAVTATYSVTFGQLTPARAEGAQ